jgi:hypothetical protein
MSNGVRIITVVPLTIKVTETDIAHGVKASCRNCPISLAGLRAIPKANPLLVLGNGISFMIEDEYHNYELPENAQLFITKFDNGIPVEPFEFTIPFETRT